MAASRSLSASSLLAGQFLAGINLPWQIYGCDFGANAWQPDGGLSVGNRVEALRERLAPLADQGNTIVRWFLFCDGRAGVVRNPQGVARGVDDHVWRDLDAALALLDSLHQRAVFVLFDFHWFRRRRVVEGVTLGGGRRDVSCLVRRAYLVERLVRPLLDRYGQDERIAAWDLVNEPEWATFLVGSWNPFSTVRRSSMVSFIGDLAQAAHGKVTQPVTVGLASPRGLPLVNHAKLDFLQWHWYPGWRSRGIPDARAVAGAIPALLGEFPTANGSMTPAAVLDEARALGYAGALSWSLLARDRHTASSSRPEHRA